MSSESYIYGVNHYGMGGANHFNRGGFGYNQAQNNMSGGA